MKLNFLSCFSRSCVCVFRSFGWFPLWCFHRIMLCDMKIIKTYVSEFSRQHMKIMINVLHKVGNWRQIIQLYWSFSCFVGVGKVAMFVVWWHMRCESQRQNVSTVNFWLHFVVFKKVDIFFNRILSDTSIHVNELVYIRINWKLNFAILAHHTYQKKNCGLCIHSMFCLCFVFNLPLSNEKKRQNIFSPSSCWSLFAFKKIQSVFLDMKTIHRS